MSSCTQGYGSHPTVFGHLSNEDLYALYEENTWKSLDEGARQQVLQETVNRSAAEKGEIGSCEVRFAPLGPDTLGQQSANVIELNHSVFVNDLVEFSYNGQIISQPVVDSNFRALETVLHEDVHAWQNQAIDGTIQINDQQLLSEYRANNFTFSYIQQSDGTVQAGSHYLNGETDKLGYYMYYFQSTERDAHYIAEQQTMQILQNLESEFGTSLSSQTYRSGIAAQGYDATYQMGQQAFQNADFAKEINQVLSNHYYGTSIQVDPAIEAAVNKEMIISMQAQMRSSAENKEEKTGKGYTPVTVEDYDRSMRDTVNAFYEHAIYDPSMSHEEAISQTGQVAENYHNAMEEVNEAHENGEIASESDVVQSTEGPAAENDISGMDNSDAGVTGEDNIDDGPDDGGADDGGVDD